MTAQEKERITRLRGEGKSYGALPHCLAYQPARSRAIVSGMNWAEPDPVSADTLPRVAANNAEPLSSKCPDASTSASAQMPAGCSGGQRTGTS